MFNLFKRKKRVRARILSTLEFNQEIIENKKTAIITFSTAWCGACKMQKPLINDLANTHKELDLLVGLVDTDAQTDLSQLFQIKGIPTTIAFKDSKPVFRHSGVLTRRDLERLVSDLTKTS